MAATVVVATAAVVTAAVKDFAAPRHSNVPSCTQGCLRRIHAHQLHSLDKRHRLPGNKHHQHHRSLGSSLPCCYILSNNLTPHCQQVLDHGDYEIPRPEAARTEMPLTPSEAELIMHGHRLPDHS